MTTRPGFARSRRVNRFLRSCAVFAAPTAALLLASTEASAQGWMKDRRFQEGAGIKAGDFELHPGIGAEIGYDSNWFFRTHKEGANLANGAPQHPERGGAVLRITPSFAFSTVGARRIDSSPGAEKMEPRVLQLRGQVSATYREFFGAEELRRQRNVSVAAGVRADINAGRPIAFGIFAGYNRLIQPNIVADPNLSFNRSDLMAGAEAVVTPGGGTLDIRGGYQIRAALYEEQQGVPYSNLNHTVSVRNRWRFRPRTALFHDTGLSWVTYPNAHRAVHYLNDSTPLRTRGGVTGLITEWLGTTLAVGYGGTFFKNPAAISSTQFDSLLAQAELVFYLSKSGGAGEPGQDSLVLSTITAGYLRDFTMSLLGNWYTVNRGYAAIEYWFGGKAVVNLSGYVEDQGYEAAYFNNPGGAPTQATGAFNNLRVNGALFGEYRVSDSVGINTTIDYTQTFSDTQIPAGGGQVYDLNWRRFQAFLGARWFL